MRPLLITALLSILFLCGFSQEGIAPLRSNLSYRYTNLTLNKVNTSSSSALKTQSVSIQLPFKDDFYYATLSNYPRMSLWNDSDVFVNSGYPIAPPSIGVATFDGLNKYGYPYEPNLINLNESHAADTLTSKPINLSLSGSQVLQPSDSIGLSFYYQARGNGEPPEVWDSLILDFYKPAMHTWISRVWFAKGNTSPNTNDTAFKRAFIWIDSLSFLKDSFQFRFRNKATTAGNFDHWHLDYVYLNKNRSMKADTIYNDLTFANVPSSFLLNYSAMPFEQYVSSEMAQKNSVRIKNNGAQTIIMSYENRFYNKNKTLLHSYNGGAANLPPFKPNGYSTYTAHATPAFGYTFAPLADTADFTIKHYLYRSQSTSPDFLTENDTIFQTQIFRNYFAYDDGGAEGGYYVNGTNGKMALRFNLNAPDTLRAVRIYFDPAGSLSTVEQSYKFRITLWSSAGGGPGSIYFKDSLMLPRYSDSIFKAVPEYKLTSKLLLSPGTYFIGIQQQVASGIVVGFDVNQDRHQNLYFDSGTGWQQSQIKGALMIHPVFGKYIAPPLSVTNYQKSASIDLFVYPNPSNDRIHVMQAVDAELSTTLVNLLGEVVMEDRSSENQHSFSVAELSSGVYLLVIRKAGVIIHQQKMIIQH